MNYLLSLEVVPLYEVEEMTKKYVESAIEMIEESPLTYYIGPTETTVEGSLKELTDLIAIIDRKLTESGCDNSIFNMKLTKSNQEVSIVERLENYYEF